MKTIAMIPARYAATRFPGKLMQLLGDKTIIARTYENTMATRLFDEVIVVTDSEIIFNEITQYGGYVIMSKQPHESGSDRIAEAIADLDVDIVVNVQGDEPFVKKEPLQHLLKAFNAIDVQVASLMHQIKDEKIITDINTVKVVVDNNSNALLFSRSKIPYPREASLSPLYFKHIGVYAYRKDALMRFTALPITPLEFAEKIECLRYLENGIPIKMIITDEPGPSIDTPDDLVRAMEWL
ncbi:MAG: 3-deoxy-manno-octulosonate cytidylyltransferase [Chitinophagaceae bacterium]|nr:3-deoxy-manno-octulosonate cytidylyltransferase [Chitinophagaceae bacterium]